MATARKEHTDLDQPAERHTGACRIVSRKFPEGHPKFRFVYAFFKNVRLPALAAISFEGCVARCRPSTRPENVIYLTIDPDQSFVENGCLVFRLSAWPTEVTDALERRPHIYRARRIFRRDTKPSGNRARHATWRIPCRVDAYRPAPVVDAPLQREATSDYEGYA
jgi:hypothetical protein